MNIFVLLVLLSLLDAPAVEINVRSSRRSATTRACIRRRETARYVIKNWDGKVYDPYTPDFDIPGCVSIYGRTTKTPKGKVSNKWDTFYFKTRSYVDTGRVRYGDKKRKGKRPYASEPIDKIRFKQALKDYIEYGE